MCGVRMTTAGAKQRPADERAGGQSHPWETGGSGETASSDASVATSKGLGPVTRSSAEATLSASLAAPSR